MLTTLSLMLACGGGSSVAVTSRAHPDAPAPKILASSLDREFMRPIKRCYDEALASESDLRGTVTLTVYGSHGILKQTAEGSAPPALLACAKAPLEDGKRMRRFGDGPVEVGFILDVTFAP